MQCQDTLQIETVLALAEFIWAFLSSNDLIGTNRLTTMAGLLDWCRNMLRHFWGSPSAASMTAHWGYAGFPPVSRVIRVQFAPSLPVTIK